MRPLVIRGYAWRVVRVSPDDPLLIDRTGMPKLATTDPMTKTIRISNAIMPPMFDKVYLHEASHAAMEEAGINDLLAGNVLAEELLAWFLENHGIEVVHAVSTSLGRPVCVSGLCVNIGTSQYLSP